MTEVELVSIVRLWQSRLGLDTWDIKTQFKLDDDEDETETVLAQCWRARDYDQGRISFNSKLWPSWTPIEAHRTAVHELLHLVLRDVEFIGDLIDGHLHRDVDQLVQRSHRHHVEQAVERLSCRFVDLAIGVDT